MRKKFISLLLSLVALIATAQFTHAEEQTVFGPDDFEIGAWRSHLSRHTFDVDSPGDGYIAISKNTPEEDINGGFLIINWRVIPLRHFLKGNDLDFFKDIKLKTHNRLTVFLRGTPGVSVKIEIKSADSPIPPPEITFSADSVSIISGESSTLSWEVTNADTITIDNGIGSVSPTGSMVISPLETTPYNITAIGPGGTASDSVTVTVTPAPPTVDINANPETIEIGQSTTLSWTSTDAESCVIEPDINEVDPNGSIIVSPTETTTYTIVAEGLGGEETDTVTVTVTNPPPTVDINASPETIELGGSSTLFWTSTDADSCVIEPGTGSVDPSGSVTVSPSVTTTYTITATGLGGTATDTVTVTAQQPPTVSISASPETILLGESATLTWSSSYAGSATIDYGVGSVPVDGSTSVSPTETTTYTITVTGSGGTATDSVTVNVTYPAPTVDISANPEAIVPEESSTLSWSSSNADSCFIEPGVGAVETSGSIAVSPSMTTTYTITATGLGGTVTDTVTVTVASSAPTVSISADPGTIQIGESSTLSWSSSDADTCVIDSGIGSVGLNGSVVVSPVETATYTITTTGPGGTSTGSVTIYVSNPSLLPTVNFSASPLTISQGEVSTLSWSSTKAQHAHIDNGIGVVSVDGSIDIYPDHTTTYTIAVTGSDGSASSRVTVMVTGNPEPQSEGSFGEQYEDLIPPDATVDEYDPKRFSLVTGLIQDVTGAPIESVSISIHDHPEYGTAFTDEDGRFILTVEGGATNTIEYQKQGLITAHRQVYVPWNDVAICETIQMIVEDPISTTITFNGDPETIITHQSTEVTDAFGSRSCTMVFTGDNLAYLIDEDGNDVHELSTITTRATEYTTPESMPAKLPPNSAYTYCAELCVDGAERVRFENPVIIWVDNFLGFDVGEIVPAGYYDRDRGVWVPADNGVVVRLLDTDMDGIVDALDADGDDLPDDLNENCEGEGGSTCYSDEVIGLSGFQKYPPNSTFWRVAVNHFCPEDFNWPYAPPGDAIPPNPEGGPKLDEQLEEEKDCLNPNGSYVEERSGIVHEDIVIPGTNITLHNKSGIAKGRQTIISVPASGDRVPFNLSKIDVAIEVAGRVLKSSLDPLPNQKAEFIWDGLDFLNRQVAGPIKARVKIGFFYPQWRYDTPMERDQAFAKAGIGSSGITGRYKRGGSTIWKESDIVINRVLNKGRGIIAEGWTISPHHYISPLDMSTLHKGDGTINKNTALIIDSLLDEWTIESGEGEDFDQLASPRSVVSDAEGSLFIADFENNRVIKLDTTGTVTTVAGNGMGGFSGDNCPATEAEINGPIDLAIDSSGNLYIADSGNNVIRKVDTEGIISTVAGIPGGDGFSDGDGGPATQTYMNGAWSIAVDNSGNLYIGEFWESRIRKVSTSGIIDTIVGDGTWGYSGDGGPAMQSQLSSPHDLTFDTSGNLYIADSNNHVIRKIDKSGIITTVGGNGTNGYSGDLGPATQAQLSYPRAVMVDTVGNLYISGSNNVVRRIDTSGIIVTIAGDGTSGGMGDGGPALKAQLNFPHGLVLSASRELYIADSGNNKIRKMSPLSALTSEESLVFTEEAGIGHIMELSGRHKKTIDLDTGKTLYEFSYDQDNNLVSLTDRFGNQTSIARDGSGIPTAIISPDGITTTLSIDSDNHLTEVTYLNGSIYMFEYTSDGLLTSKIEPEGNRFEHEYNQFGQLKSVSDDSGGNWAYTRTSYDSFVSTEVITGEGNITSYLDQTLSTGEYNSIITGPTGAETLFNQSADGLTVNKSLSCGMDLEFKYDVDSEYKFKVIKEMKESTPSALERTTLKDKVYEDTDSDDIPDQITETVTVNGKSTTLKHDVLQSQKTITSPEGRTATSFYNPNTLLVETMSIPGLLDTDYEYDTRGRMASVLSGTRETSYVYNTQGFVESVTDPENYTTSFIYDPVGRITTINRPDSTSIGFSYDANGNMTVLTNPSSIDHVFDSNAVNLASSYQTPLSGSYSYLYDKDRKLVQTTFPSGKQITNIHDTTQLSQIQTPEGNIDFSYLCSTKVDSITNGTDTITYGYDGKLVTSKTLSGNLPQSLSYTYNNDFNVTGFTYAGGSASYSYDNDGLLTGAGHFSITRNALNGMPEAVTGGAMSLDRTFNGYGEVEEQDITVGGQGISTWTLTRDNNGRITNKTETVGGVTAAYDYEYDEMGRLVSVTKDGTLVEEYGYDTIPYGTCTNQMNSLRGITDRTLQYDNEDKLLSADGISYQYDLDGFLTIKTDGSDITTYNYSTRGELLSVTLPDSTLIEYIHDPLGRRIVKKVNGTVIEKYLWQGLTKLLAVYDGSDSLLQRFEYADGRMPISMTQGGVTYSLTYDQVGSLRLVADASGNVVKRVECDSFGNILSDSNPAFEMPFGFAGGLYDRDTGLVRFGYRDYDSDVGRWTAKDPILFDGGDTDIYGYCLNDPINWVDSNGQFINLGAAGIGAAIGAGIGAANAYFRGESVLQGALTGAAVGSLAGLSFGTSLIANSLVGASIGAVTDTAMQYYSNPCGNIDTTSVFISAFSGAIGGGMGTAMIKGMTPAVDAALFSGVLSGGASMAMHASANY